MDLIHGRQLLSMHILVTFNYIGNILVATYITSKSLNQTKKEKELPLAILLLKNNSYYFTCPENSMVTLSQKSRILKLNVCYVLWQCMNGWHFCLFCRNKVSLKWKIQCLCFTSPQHGWGPHHWHGPCSEPFSANSHFWVCMEAWWT